MTWQLQSGDLANSVAEMLEITGLAPSLLELEVTEDILLVKQDKALGHVPQHSGPRRSAWFSTTSAPAMQASAISRNSRSTGLRSTGHSWSKLRADSGDAAIVGSTIGLSSTGLVGDRRRHRGPCAADFAGEHGCEEGQGYFFGPADAGAGIRESKFLMMHDAAAKVLETRRGGLAGETGRGRDYEFSGGWPGIGERSHRESARRVRLRLIAMRWRRSRPLPRANGGR